MQVRVWNDNQHPFTQELAEKVYKIGPRECLEMDEEEADRLLKAFSPIEVDYDGKPTPRSYKMLRLDPEDLARNKAKKANKSRSGTYLCQACGYVAANQWELNGHTEAEHKDQWEDLSEARAAIAGDTAPEEPKKRTRNRKKVGDV